MTPDERMEALFRGLAPAEQLPVMAALWDALQHVRPTNQTPAEWAAWFERFVNKTLRGKRG